MKKLGIFFAFLLCSTISFAQDSKDVEYIRRHAKLAVEEMHLYKIPASITLSQGILETGGGQSRLAEIKSQFQKATDRYQSIEKEIVNEKAPVKLIGKHQLLKRDYVRYVAECQKMVDAVDLEHKTVDFETKCNLQSSATLFGIGFAVKIDKLMKRILMLVKAIATFITSLVATSGVAWLLRRWQTHPDRTHHHLLNVCFVGSLDADGCSAQPCGHAG